uniref:Uncharacterized protein n=1 Tax=Roseihalotalea indica TaxID=2867963 RepID=A0AA49GQ01_9BACT|nr:hypothetical protein K4G66_03825 [Tunicatimonas sp. TK19036]
MICLILTLFSSSSFCLDNPEDLGSCIRYQVTITTSENEIIEGIFQHATYFPIFKFSEIGFKEFIDSVAYNDTITIYRKVHQLTYPNNDNRGLNCVPVLYAIAQEDIVKIPSSNILKADLKGYEPCDNCTSNNEKAGFDFNGRSTITELTSEEIKLLQQNPEASYQFWYPDSEEEPIFGYGSYQILSYNKKIGINSLKEIANTLVKADIEDARLDAYNSYAGRQKRYKELKENLRRKNVILFTVHEAP